MLFQSEGSVCSVHCWMTGSVISCRSIIHRRYEPKAKWTESRESTPEWKPSKGGSHETWFSWKKTNIRGNHASCWESRHDASTRLNLRLSMVMWIFWMHLKSSLHGMDSGSLVRNCTKWMKSASRRISSYNFKIPVKNENTIRKMKMKENFRSKKRCQPRAVLKRNSSPSRQKTSHTRLATSSGRDFAYSVNILKRTTNLLVAESSEDWSRITQRSNSPINQIQIRCHSQLLEVIIQLG